MSDRSGRRARHRRHKARTKQAWLGPRRRMWFTVRARQWVRNEQLTLAAAMARQELDVEGDERRRREVIEVLANTFTESFVETFPGVWCDAWPTGEQLCQPRSNS